MAGAGGGMAVLPQYQGDYYTLQRQQALAQALAQQALTPQQIQPTGSGQYTVMPKYNLGAGVAQLGQALLAAKLGNQVSQGYQQLGANQMAAFSGAPQQTQMAQPGTTANPFSGGQGGTADGSGASGAPVPQSAPAMGGGSQMNPLGLPPALAWSAYNADPAKYAEIQAAAFKPADIVSQIRAAGIDPNSALGRQVAQQALAKANYIAPTSIRGQFYADADGIHALPAPAPEGYQQVPDGKGGFQIVPQQGGPEAVAANATAKAIGPATFNMSDVWDPNANGGKGGYVRQSAANQAQAAGAVLPSNGLPATQDGTANGAPMTPLQRAVMSTESFGNPKAVSPKGASGTMQTMPTTLLNPGFGVRPAQNNSPAEMQRVGVDFLEAMRQKYGNDTDALVAYNMGPGAADKWISGGRQWSQLPQETQGYIGKTLTQANNFSGAQGGGQPQRSGPMASQPPLGTTNAANASQGAPSELMKNSYGAMSSADSAYQQSREALTEMIDLANKKGTSGAAVGVLPSSIGTKISPDAAKYQKLHATYVASQGKALGASGTDAARATIDEAVPTYDKPQSAMVSGLQTQLNNLDLAHLKTQFLTPLYQQGNEKAFTQQSAAFDQNIKPTMVPVLQLSGDQQRAAVQQAIKANPALRSSYEWAFNNGLLK